jgi:hypothetical protein
MADNYPPKDDAEVGSQNYYITKKPLIDPEKPKYLEHPEPNKKKYKNYKNAEQGAPNRDKPTTADAVKGLLNLPSAMAAVDPSGISSVAPMMYSMLGQISAAASGSSQSSRKVTVQDALTGALAILSNKYSFDQITAAFDKALRGDGINLIDADHRDIVKNAVANLYNLHSLYGQAIPTSTYNTVTTVGKTPSPIVTTVPDFYVKQYYTPENDPYPGYTQWLSPDKTTSVYTQKTIGELVFSSPTEEVYSEAERFLAAALDPYIAANTLTAQILNDLINQADAKVDKDTQENAGGKNSSNQLMNILMQLAGYVGIISNLQQSIQLPVSVLNQGSIKSSQQDFLKNIAELRRRKALAKTAAQPASPAAALGQISGLSSSAQSLYNTIKS